MLKHTHNKDDKWLFDNGCLLCIAIDSIKSYADDTAVYPPWITTEEAKEAACVDDIRYIINQLRNTLPAFEDDELSLEAGRELVERLNDKEIKRHTGRDLEEWK